MTILRICLKKFLSCQKYIFKLLQTCLKKIKLMFTGRILVDPLRAKQA